MEGTFYIFSMGICGTIKIGQSILEALRSSGNACLLETACNGKGTCGKCRIKVMSQGLSPLSGQEKKQLTDLEIEEGIRLACMTRYTGETERITFDIVGHKSRGKVMESLHLDTYRLDPGKTGYGIAVDIGTTTVVAVLADLATGGILGKASAINPQVAYGGDVLSRIEYTMQVPHGLETLKRDIGTCIVRLTEELAGEGQIQVREISRYMIAGNCTMLHLLLGVSPASIAMAPYHPQFVECQRLRAGQLGWEHGNPDAELYCLPSVSAYIGADIVAGMISSGLYRKEGSVLLIDIGTNGELVLSRNGELSACSCAAGPALEGMNISCGMRAADGAIERVSFQDGTFAFQTIGGKPPMGFCGSGVLEMMETLLREGAVEPSGRLAKDMPCSFLPFMERIGKEKSFLIEREPPIRFSQGDVRQIQLAKGAILSGIEALLKIQDICIHDLDEIIIAGQFGAYIKSSTMINVGILPEDTSQKIRYIGNSSLAGAVLCLLDQTMAGLANRLTSQVSYVNLAEYKEYSRLLMKCMRFPVIAER